MVFARHFEHGGEGLLVLIDLIPDHVGNVLVHEHDRNVLAVGERLERLLDQRQRRLRIDDKKV